MKRFIDFCKKEYKIMIPVMVVLVLLVTVYFLYREYKYDNYRNKQEVSVYQYFGGNKKEYTAIVTYNLKDAIVDVSAKNEKIDYDSTPIYFEKEDKILFPQEMSIVFPLQQGSQFKLYKYSMYEKTDEINMIKTGVNTDKYEYFFLFDGNNLYFFPDSVELKINGKVYKKLSPMSYVTVIGGYTLIYYDRESDTSEVIELDNDEITVISDTLDVNISNNYCLVFNKKVLLVDTDKLNSVS